MNLPLKSPAFQLLLNPKQLDDLSITIRMLEAEPVLICPQLELNCQMQQSLNLSFSPALWDITACEAPAVVARFNPHFYSFSEGANLV